MNEGRLLRLLELVQRELGATDARAELGGREPEDPRLVWCKLPNGWRVVTRFDQVPEDRAGLEARLQALSASFGLMTHPPSFEDDRLPSGRDLAARRLDEELHGLALRVRAVRAVVIDSTSPIIWGTSEPRHGSEDVDTALRTAKALEVAKAANLDLVPLLQKSPQERAQWLRESVFDPTVREQLERELSLMREQSRRQGEVAWQEHLLTVRAIATVRARLEASPKEALHLVVRHEGFGCVARSFAAIYVLIVVFDHLFSELHAEGTVVHALPVIEALVLALPPIEPPPPGGKALRLLR